MRVQLIKESTGFGFNSMVANWSVEDIENITLLEKVKKGIIVELPERVAINIYNLVDVDSGEIVSKISNASITSNELKLKYKSTKEDTKLKAEIKASFKPKVKIKTKPQVKEEVEEKNNQ